MDEESRQRLDGINSRGGKYQVAVVPIGQLELLEKNARFMTNEQFTNLVNNIRKDGELSSVPFCVKIADDRFRVLSGNHRVQAAKTAGLADVLILYTEEQMSREKEVSVILSHNAIAGQDDMQTLKELYEEIRDVDLRYYCGLDDIVLDKMEKLSMPPLSEMPIEWRQVSFVFLPEEADRLKATLDEMIDRVRGDEGYLARFSDYDRLLDTLECVKKSTNVKNVATAFMLMLDVVEAHMDELPGYIKPDEGEKTG